MKKRFSIVITIVLFLLLASPIPAATRLANSRKTGLGFYTIDRILALEDNQIDIGNVAGVSKVLNFASAGVQTLTIIGEDNSTSEGPRDVAISHTSSSTDAAYTGLTISDQVVTVEDDEPWCGMVGTTYFDSDLNEDCHVTLEDFAILAANWLGCTHPADAGCN